MQINSVNPQIDTNPHIIINPPSIPNNAVMDMLALEKKDFFVSKNNIAKNLAKSDVSDYNDNYMTALIIGSIAVFALTGGFLYKKAKGFLKK